MHGVTDEGQRAAAEGFPDELRLHIDDAVGEPGIGARAAVVEFVGVQHVHLAGKAHMPAAAIPEDLDASRRDPDRVRVVPVGREAAMFEPIVTEPAAA